MGTLSLAMFVMIPFGSWRLGDGAGAGDSHNGRWLTEATEPWLRFAQLTVAGWDDGGGGGGFPQLTVAGRGRGGRG